MAIRRDVRAGSLVSSVRVTVSATANAAVGIAQTVEGVADLSNCIINTAIQEVEGFAEARKKTQSARVEAYFEEIKNETIKRKLAAYKEYNDIINSIDNEDVREQIKNMVFE